MGLVPITVPPLRRDRRKSHARPAETACDSLHWLEGALRKRHTGDAPRPFPCTTLLHLYYASSPFTVREEGAQQRVKERSGRFGTAFRGPRDRRAGVPWRHRCHRAEGHARGETDGSPGTARDGIVSKSVAKAPRTGIGPEKKHGISTILLRRSDSIRAFATDLDKQRRRGPRPGRPGRAPTARARTPPAGRARCAMPQDRPRRITTSGTARSHET